MRCVLASLALLSLGSALPAQEVLEETFEDGRPRIRREVRRTATGEALNHGEYKEWYANGKVRSKGEYASGLRTGRWLMRWENGRRQAQGSYTNGERDGIWQLYAEAGPRFARGAYLAGVRDGEWTFWTPGRELDPDRSGVYRATVLADDTAAGWEGETLDGQRHGRWTYFRPHRRTMMVGDYERGAMHGAWLFLHQVPMTGAISRSPVDTEFQNALAAEALVEGATTSGIPVVRQSAYRTIAYLTAMQHGDGSWGTTIDDDRGHPVVTATVLRALHAARAAGIAVDEQHLVRGLAWLHGRTDLARGEGEGRMSGALTSHSSAAATAATLLVRMLAGQAPELPIVRIQARWLKSHPPVVFPDMDENDPLYVYLGTSALRYVGGGEWAAWSDAAHDLLATALMSHGAQAATWDPLGLQYGAPGGRLWSTALAALTLEELLRPK